MQQPILELDLNSEIKLDPGEVVVEKTIRKNNLDWFDPVELDEIV